MNEKIIKKAEGLSLQYDSEKDRITFLTGFVEGFKHLKGTGYGEIYETGKAYGAREFHEMTSRRDDRAFRKAMKQKYNHTNQERIK
ncbi:hypothetical protein QMM42_17985 [Leptospira santarosai]|uniref:hypothetical protein n=1 Tax=Leptospira santarosai TaxID=28183 RepID=UPI0024AF8483|nr:hypothetical protein [Leptospira santarosai]MBW9233567.1 hypothetical protein [Leptospira santarosai]MDI7188058.1 hypothetical protein [Leptospira santarosai]MDI7200144.1 hypothetical protein [Leptospira santarosai]